MPTSASDAVASRPTVEEEMSKFKGFSSTNGDVSDGEPLVEENEILEKRQQQRDQSKAAQKADDDARAAEAAKGAEKAAKTIELTADEEDTAAEAAEAEKGEPLTDEEREKAIADALAKKQADAAAKPAKGKRTVQERINAYRRAAGAAERHAAAKDGENEELRRRLAAYEKGEVKPGEQVTKKAAPAGDKEPQPADFEFGELDPKYIRALARYEAKQEAAQAKQEIAQDRQTAAQQREMVELKAKADAVVERGIAEFEDFEELVIDGAKQGAWALSQDMLTLMAESEVGHKVAYHLASNPKEAARIAGLTPMGQAAAFGRLEARFSSESSDAAAAEQEKTKVDPSKVAKTTKAPNPVKPARGAGGSNQVGGDTSDFAAFEALVKGSSSRRN